MVIINPDATRMIDLQGVGPCPRPVDIDQKQTGFKTLKSLRIYRFQPGPPIHGESEVDEVFILPLTGEIQMAIFGRDAFQGQISAAGQNRALYMAPHHAYRLSPKGDATVAYARAEAVGKVPVQAVSGDESAGLAEHLSFRRVTLRVGEAMAVSGAEVLVHVIAGAMRGVGGYVAAGQTMALTANDARDLVAVGGTDLLIVSA